MNRYHALLLPLVLLAVFPWSQAADAAQAVSSASQLRSALAASSSGSINITNSLSIGAWATPAQVRGQINITGNPGVILDFGMAPRVLIHVDGGSLVFSNITLANFSAGVKNATPGPVPEITLTSGSLFYDHVVFYTSSKQWSSPGTGLHQIRYWDWHAQPVPLLAASDGPAPATQSLGLTLWNMDGAETSTAVINSTLIRDGGSCFSSDPGTAMVFDSSSLRQALAAPAISRTVLLQNVTLDPGDFTVREPVIISRPVTLDYCPDAVLSLNELGACILVTTGGRLSFQQGATISGTKALLRSNWPTANSLLLSAVDINGSGTVVLRDARLLTSALVNTQEVISAYPEAAQPKFEALDPGLPNHMLVQEWNLTQQMFQQYIAPMQLDPANDILQTSRLQARRRLLHLGTPAATLGQQRASSGMDAAAAGAAAAAASRRQLLAAPGGPAPANNSYWALTNVTQQKTAYAGGSCFSDFEGFVAEDVVQFKRLLQDPAATHIELKGDIIFDDETFPPANANDKSKGLNVTHRVEIRACGSSLNKPIIVDVNNLQQQIYVFGFMRWHGNIRFINSFPSPRRAGLFPLISVLSVEDDGIIEFEDLHIHGNEPCPLFDDNDPFWEQYERDPAFVPRQGDFVRLRNNALLLLDWRFVKSAWVKRTQGKTGVVPPTGSGYWSWVNVLVTWSPHKSTGAAGLSGPIIAAVVVPIVVFVAIIAALVGFLLWRRKRRPGKSGPLAKPSQEAGVLSSSMSGSGVSANREGTFDSAGSRLDATKSSTGTHELIEEARRRMQTAATGKRDASIILEGLLGEGTFGKVYRGHWQGTLVAVKTMLFPAAMSGKEKREKMAIMETAISSSLSHPNIVQTYTYVVKPLTGELAAQAMEMGPLSVIPSDALDASDTSLGHNSRGDHGWEVRLVLELCDRGSLKELLSSGALMLPSGRPDMVAVIATALDVARAMLHLHTENIVHSDLKARNVLLKSAGTDARGFVAKVSDFGLSVRMDPTETHVSNVYQGTLTHMAPEVLVHGKISRASDVYAFGILLWELYTGQQAFKGTPRVLLGHEVTKLGRRPEFPPECPFDYQLLACRCWESDPGIRPSFQQILADLQRMAAKLSTAGPDSASSLSMPRSSLSGSATSSAAGPQGLRAHSGSGGDGRLPGRPGELPQLDPAKLHNWEPQTSLLDLNSMSDMQTGGSSLQPGHPRAQTGGLMHLWCQQQQQQASAAAAAAVQDQQVSGQHGMWPVAGAAAAGAAAAGVAAAGAGHATPIGASSSSQQMAQSLGSWGDQSGGGGGLWLGGDFAPDNLPSDVQLPDMHGSNAFAAPGGSSSSAAGMAAQQQQQQGVADDPTQGRSSTGLWLHDSMSTLSQETPGWDKAHAAPGSTQPAAAAPVAAAEHQQHQQVRPLNMSPIEEEDGDAADVT